MRETEVRFGNSGSQLFKTGQTLVLSTVMIVLRMG